MRLLVSWVRDFVDVTAPPEAIAETLALRGFEVASIEPAPDGVRPPWAQGADLPDAVIDFEVTANRPDCLSVIGFAREIATAFQLPFHALADSPPPLDGAPGGAAVDVQIEDAVRCPRYAAALAEVLPATSPRWMTARLLAAGVRPISPFVDITNYVLLELGHPMHAFDQALLAGNRIKVRCAAAGETITTLDGVTRKLEPEMLVIADGARPQAIAGVMGGAHSEVSSTTTRVVFESACFQPASVRRTSKRLGLKTEASARFERGADVNAPAAALTRALDLMERIGAGRPASGLIDCYPAPRAPLTIGLRRARLDLVLGLQVPDEDAERILRSLGLTVTGRSDGWSVEVPTFRVDLLREIDLIEEVGRHHGFDKLEPAFPVMTMAAAAPDPRVLRDRSLRNAASAAGLTEAVTFGFIESAAARLFVDERAHGTIVAVANPLSATFDVLRPSLLPGLLDVVAHNRRHGRRDAAVFEIGSRFTTAGGERRAVALAWTGAATPEHWSGTGREVDFFDVKGILERLAGILGVPVQLAASTAPYLVPGQAARVMAGDVCLGMAGLLGPKVVEARGAPKQDKIFVAELDLETIASQARAALGARGADTSSAEGRLTSVAPLPRFPSVVRDLSIVVPERLSAESIRGTIQAAAADAAAPLVSMAFFDRYKGKGVADEAVSLSVRLTFQAADRTLTDADVQQSFDRVLAALVHQHGAVQR
jgi:phenylalanyl-tRNA synthetase beta chain